MDTENSPSRTERVSSSRPLGKGSGWTEQLMWMFTGMAKNPFNKIIPSDLVEYIQATLSPYCVVSPIEWVKAYDRAVLHDADHGFSVEVYSRFRRRDRQMSRKGRVALQSHWIAANYASDFDERVTETYYGSILGLYEVGVYLEKFRCPENEVLTLKFIFCKWQDGLHVNKGNGTVSTQLKSGTRKQSILGTYNTFEHISCVDRKIGYFDHASAR
ncbi:hypothetical protein BWQ96_09769 [Gracilariopsis chorda]|uniref:Uncharacterized protein n=1 Tax=Gracilariopsis chorda TaxID=448386 RepID=A0A2V3IEK0_9FLOR|nr:hypothetical protein BWQ96_10843 [Gracilariopsis chorda]PXF40516.1 hypothetical protein BWQ96_09769 [Gracilariopsis chorda]|eukprot:PXF39470.1 hypothetical protein BWQ96_10843 [Gracilariopsis chorda]